MWYLSPLACLYDFMQPGFGHLKGLERRSDAAGRESVVDGAGVLGVLGAAEDDPDPDPEDDAPFFARADADEGDPARDCDGVVIGVFISLALAPAEPFPFPAPLSNMLGTTPSPSPVMPYRSGPGAPRTPMPDHNPAPGATSFTLPLELTINGEARHLHVAPWTSLLDLLREHLGLTGTKKGCDHGQCGSCAVLRRAADDIAGDPGARAAIEDAGITVADYLAMTVAVHQALAMHDAERMARRANAWAAARRSGQPVPQQAG